MACSLLSAAVLAIVVTAAAIAQQSQPAKYDVIAIRPNTSDQSGSSTYTGPGSKIRTVNVNVHSLVMMAYDVRPYQVEGGPPWMKSTGFDVQAQMDQEDLIDEATLTPMQRREQKARHRALLQNLLADRFGLKIRREKKEMPGYLLTVGKNGHKLQPPSVEQKNSGTHTSSGPARVEITGNGLSMSSFAETLSSLLDRTVVDATNLQGGYDFKLQWTPDEAAAAAAGTSSSGSVFTAIQEQLGLKLDSKKVATEIIVVERLEQPSEN